ncbi:MAG: MFS transporter [Devosia sp.]|nr:MFS transporter [Devosia sp.]
MKPSVNQAWGVLAATSLMISLSMALPIYGGSVTNTYMAVALGWKREVLGLLVAANMVANALCAPLAAIAIGRFGVRGTMAVGCALIGLAGVAMATVVTLPWHALIAFGLIIGGGSALAGIIPCQTAVAGWFDRRRTMALSIMYAAQGLGGFLAAFLINNAIFASGTWRSGWWVFAIAGALGVVVAALFVRDAPDGAGASADPEPFPRAEMARPGEVQKAIIQDALRSPLLWATYVCMLTLMVGSGFIIGHAQVHLRGLGFSPSSAASAISLMSVAMVIGNLGFGVLASRVGLKATYIAAGATYCIGLVLLTQIHSYPLLWAFSLVAGTGFGAGQVGAMAMLGHYWSTRAFPALTALGLLLQTAGGGMAPILAGAYFDSHGTYLPVIWTLAAMNLASAAFLLAVVVGRSGGAATAAQAPVAGADLQS